MLYQGRDHSIIELTFDGKTVGGEITMKMRVVGRDDSVAWAEVNMIDFLCEFTKFTEKLTNPKQESE